MLPNPCLILPMVGPNALIERHYKTQGAVAKASGLLLITRWSVPGLNKTVLPEPIFVKAEAIAFDSDGHMPGRTVLLNPETLCLQLCLTSSGFYRRGRLCTERS
jgi:hypothetical protein